MRVDLGHIRPARDATTRILAETHEGQWIFLGDLREHITKRPECPSYIDCKKSHIRFGSGPQVGRYATVQVF